eukprot:TRINITY_DN5522_c0_g1_i1.p1 TRINITY_DN5522_c0_g1~~TRINITY_DN5522_c0_g1_i1.p1  ORF type:complete len:375 (-),score=101.00 TRINITY_DN5522_c0_g1_i1:21-1085(-)
MMFHRSSGKNAYEAKSQPPNETFLVTGGQGFIGAWVVKHLLRENEVTPGRNRVVVFDLREDNNILQQVLTPVELRNLEREYGDVSDTQYVQQFIEKIKPTAIIHLAGIQIPTCKVNPLLGAKVNVIGTLNIFESARLQKEKFGVSPNIIYASSAAVSGQPKDYTGPLEDDTPHKPQTHYGVFKQANEGNARVFWLDHQIPSVGLRPFTVYGVGREVGLTSGPTKAVKAAVLDRDYKIAFGGRVCLNYVEDVARIFVECARVPSLAGAHALNIKGDIATVEEWIAALEKVVPSSKGRITQVGGELPFPVDFLETGLENLLGVPRIPTTPFPEAIQKTVELFQAVKARGELNDRDL